MSQALLLRTLAVIWMAGVAACSSSGELLVDLRTDYVAGVEVTRVEIELVAGGTESTAIAVTDDLLTGARVGHFTDVKKGAHSFELRLLSGNGVVQASRRVTISVDGVTGTTVLISRGCAVVTCPSTAGASDTECVNAVCVPPDCSPENPEACGTALCTSDADCPASAVACAVAECRSGACFDRPLVPPMVGACGEDEICASDGCRQVMTSDAGSCVAPMAMCGAECIDTQSDPVHCGACERPCLEPAMPFCSAGSCGAASCVDGILNGDEMGIDCGSATCGPCTNHTFDCSSVTSIPVIECEALVELYNATNPGPVPDWGAETWLVSPDPCLWAEGLCRGARVVHISVSDGVRGYLPSSVGDLSMLEDFVFINSGLTGTLPAEFGSLTQLLELRVSGNALSGSIPPEIGDLSSLTQLDLFENQFSGPLPSELQNLRALRSLGVRNNNFSGSLPVWLGTFPSLTQFQGTSNQFSGSIPDSIGGLTSCEWLTLADNQFSGPVPDSIRSVPARARFSLNEQTGCLTASPTTATWLEAKDPNWNDGC